MNARTWCIGLALTGMVAVAGGCAAWLGSEGSRSQEAGAQASAGLAFSNPVLDHDFADPMVLRAADGWYYGYATQTTHGGRTVNIQVARSRDLASWEDLGDALPTKPAWARTTQNTWAPHVLEDRGTYYMYYSAEPDTRDGLALAIATASSPAGPFVDKGSPLQKGPSFVNIDPMPFDDPKTGKKLLYWGSGFQPIKVQELAADRLSFMPGSKPVDVIPASKAPYENLVEGAWVIHRDGWYYMLYSGDNCCGEKPHYAVLAARSRSAMGPFEKLADVTKRPDSTILAGNDRWLGPGHNSVVTDPSGQDWIVYHAIDANSRYLPGTKDVRRPLLIDRIDYRDGWPVVAPGAPTSGSQTGPATGTRP